MLKVELVNYDDLTEEEQELQPNSGRGKELDSYVKVTDGDKTIVLLSDAVEPEDARFTRDFSTVLSALEKVYQLGVNHGKLNK